MRGFDYLTNLAVRCPLPNPLPRGEGIRLLKIRECRIWILVVFRLLSGIRLLKIRACRIGNQMSGKPENVRVWQPDSLSPWDRVRERVSKPQACFFDETYESVLFRTRFGF